MESFENSSCSKCKLKYEGEVYMLSCTHNFCETCVDTMRQGVTITCHLCATKTNKDDVIKNTFIKKINILQIPLDEDMNTFSERIKSVEDLIVSNKDMIIYCELCDPDQEINKAENYCKECEQHMCGRCTKVHARTKYSLTHKIINKIVIKKQMAMSQDPICKEHNQTLEMYCKKCSILICLVCYESNHENHYVDDNIAQLFKDSKMKIETFCLEIDQNIQQQRLAIKQNQIMDEVIIGKYNIIKADIEARKNKLKNTIDEMSSSLINELMASKQLNVRIINKNSKEIDNYIEKLNSHKLNLNNILETSSDFEIFNLMNDKIDINIFENQKPKILSNIIISYDKININNELFKKENIFGYLKDSRNISLRVHLKQCSCIAINKLYEADDQNNCINIYDIDTMMYKSSIKSWPDVQKIFQLSQIIAIDYILFLHFADYSKKSSIIYKYEDKTNTFVKWKETLFCSLSSGIKDTVLIRTLTDLSEFTVEGQVIRTFTNYCTTSTIYKPQQLDNGKYIDALRYQQFTTQPFKIQIRLISDSGAFDAIFETNVDEQIKICTDGSKYVYYLILSTGLITVLSIGLMKLREVKIQNASDILYNKERNKVMVFTNEEIQYFNFI